MLAVISDGQPNDDFEAGLERLNSEPRAKKAVRVAIAIGKDADADVLRQFTGPEYPVLAANNAEQLTEFIRWVSTEPVKSASSGSSGAPDEQSGSSAAAVHLTRRMTRAATKCTESQMMLLRAEPKPSQPDPGGVHWSVR